MPKKKRETRVWTDAERATAVALAARNGGNVKRTVRELRFPDGAAVSESTLRGWIKNPPPSPLVETAAMAFEQLPGVVRGTLMKLAVGMNRDEWIARLLASRGTNAPVTFGVLFDKLALLEGRATEITEQRTLSGFLAAAKWTETDKRKATKKDARLN